MAIDLTSIGVRTLWAAEVTKGVTPTTAARFTGVKSIPELTSDPEALETTTLDALEFKTYIPGLKDLGGALGLTANLSQELKDQWDDMMTAYETAAAAEKRLWMFFDIPGIDEAFGFTFQPTPMSPGAIEVNSVLETTLYVTPTNEPAWVTKPTVPTVP